MSDIVLDTAYEIIRIVNPEMRKRIKDLLSDGETHWLHESADLAVLEKVCLILEPGIWAKQDLDQLEANGVDWEELL